MRLSMVSAALVAALVGYGSTIALVLAAAQAVGASPVQTASWVAALCFGKAIGSLLLSTWTRIPVVLAWSTPGAAIIAASAGVNINEAVGAFIFAGALIAFTGLLAPVHRAVSAIPAGIASGMLAGVLLPFCISVAELAVTDTQWAMPLIAIFLVVRLYNPLFAVLLAFAGGITMAFALTDIGLLDVKMASQPLVFIAPAFSMPVLIGLGVPLYLVTMASQNLPGFAVLRANGYQPPVARALGVSGLGSAIVALFGAHTFNMAAITAAICVGDDVHPDKKERWKIAIAYAVIWVGLGILGPLIIPTMLALPKAVIATVAGLALVMPMVGAAGAAFEAEKTRFAAAATFIVTASGIAAFGIGAAFWGLMAGLLIHAIDPIRHVLARR